MDDYEPHEHSVDEYALEISPIENGVLLYVDDNGEEVVSYGIDDINISRGEGWVKIYFPSCRDVFDEFTLDLSPEEAISIAEKLIKQAMYQIEEDDELRLLLANSKK